MILWGISRTRWANIKIEITSKISTASMCCIEIQRRKREGGRERRGEKGREREGRIGKREREEGKKKKKQRERKTGRQIDRKEERKHAQTYIQASI